MDASTFLIDRDARRWARGCSRNCARRHRAVVDVRGRGLLVGVQLRDGIDASAVSVEPARRGVITKDTHRNTVRLSPPLVIEAAELDAAVGTLFAVLDDAADGVEPPHRAAA